MRRSLHHLFVDRSYEHGVFKDMLEQKLQQRIMVVNAVSGLGKSWLLHIFARTAREKAYPVVQIDFSDRQMYDATNIIRRCRDEIGPTYFGELNDMLKSITTPQINIFQARDERVSSLTAFSAGTDNQFGDVHIERAAGGSVIDINIHGNRFEFPESDQKSRHLLEDQLTISFFQCMDSLCTNTPVVFLFDSYEKNSSHSDYWEPRSADQWIRGQLLSRVFSGSLRNVVVVIAGLRTPEFGAEWYDILDNVNLETFQFDDVKEYLCIRRGLTVLEQEGSEAVLQALFKASAGNPRLLGTIGANLEHAHRPLRRDDEWYADPISLAK